MNSMKRQKDMTLKDESKMQYLSAISKMTE